MTLTAKPIVATIRPNTSIRGPESRPSGSEVKAECGNHEDDLRAIVKRGRVMAGTESKQRYHFGGRGMKGPENFCPFWRCADTIEQLSVRLGAVGCRLERAKVSVGQTGKTVSPTLYIACGISGANPAIAGMDPPKLSLPLTRIRMQIFYSGRLWNRGDLFEIVPLPDEEVKKAQVVISGRI